MEVINCFKINGSSDSAIKCMFVIKPVPASQTQLILRTAGYICTFICGFDPMALILYSQNIPSAPRQCLNRYPMIFSILSIFFSEFLLSYLKCKYKSDDILAIKCFFIIEKQLIRTISINLGDVELNLQ